MKTLFTHLLSLFVPQKCIHCKVPSENTLCLKCSLQLRYGITQTAHGKNCQIYSILPYENSVVKSLIYSIKSRPHQNVFNYFFDNEREPWVSLLRLPLIAIAEIPPHTKTFLRPKLRLVKLYQKIIPHAEHIIIKRIRTTSKQGLLSIEERKRNQKDSMALIQNKNITPNHTTVIVDDVITTGSSIKQAYKLIRGQYPENHIIIITLAYAKKFNMRIFVNSL